MKNIVKIYLSDTKKIFSNRVAILIIIAICILPSLYARFYLKSSWDPYGNTKGLKVAIVNNDEGTLFDGSYLNIGNEIVKELKQDENIGRVFVDEKVAEEGTKLGNYYANIVIETGFSQHFVTFLDEIPQKPKLVYTVNEKVNAIAPKITDAGTSAIKENIERQFIRTVNEVVMTKMNEIGMIIKKDQQNIYHFIDIVHNVNSDVNGLDKKIDSIIKSTRSIKNKLQEISLKIPNTYDFINDGKSILSDTIMIADDTSDILNTMPRKIEKDISKTRSEFEDIERQVSKLLDVPQNHKKEISNDIKVLSGDVSNLRGEISDIISFLSGTKSALQHLNTGNEISGDITSNMENKIIEKLIVPIDKLITKSTNIDNRLQIISEALSSSQGLLNSLDKRDNLKSSISNIGDDLDDISDILNEEIIPEFDTVLNKVSDISKKGESRLNELEDKIPDIQNDIDSGLDVINTTLDKLEQLKKKLPGIQSDISQIDSTLQEIKEEDFTDNFLSVALLNPERMADFFSSPIELVENKLFSIPNYGSAMSPFFTVLAIWVGGLLMIALFTTRVKEEKFAKCREIEKFFGKWLFFLKISIIQGLIVSLGEVILLGVYVENIGAFILTSLMCSIVFSMIAFSTVYTFGNSGKALLIIFLVLQLSGSGGTFPVEMSDPFFQTINPYLPFTYAIKAMREAVGGVVPQIFYMNLIILIGFFGIFAIIGIVIKPLISKSISKFDNKFAESELGEH